MDQITVFTFFRHHINFNIEGKNKSNSIFSKSSSKLKNLVTNTEVLVQVCSAATVGNGCVI